MFEHLYEYKVTNYYTNNKPKTFVHVIPKPRYEKIKDDNVKDNFYPLILYSSITLVILDRYSCLFSDKNKAHLIIPFEHGFDEDIIDQIYDWIHENNVDHRIITCSIDGSRLQPMYSEGDMLDIIFIPDVNDLLAIKMMFYNV